MTTINERVAAGAAMLDKEWPGWERKIDLSILDLADSCRCVLGQLHGNFYKADKDILCRSGELGFNTPALTFLNDMPSIFAKLDEVWISLIKERFNTGALSDS